MSDMDEKRAERVKEIHDWMGQMGPGDWVQVDHGAWRKFEYFEICPILGHVHELALEHRFFRTVKVPWQMVTGFCKAGELVNSLGIRVENPNQDWHRDAFKKSTEVMDQMKEES